eukprot:Gregarina_sp_Poly_1__391@NODE_1097_length_5104_cov_220_281318_g761_i0_p6_GENE_NODE_1097_length_5104_cov_220_281318_g761_i0NODE_1097_length_5104_cov_220_281318_g761_i0_p6_ORF_typecomplete_len121_score17_23C2/PF00168_30/2_1e17DUF1292/PF06949_11/0_15_NODE_1097_length_5104_cov_220_281318_g761_i036514013
MTQLKVTVISAYNLPKKSGMFDKLDPYVMCQVGAQKQQTAAHKDAGSEAQFNQILSFDYNGEPYISVSVWDDDSKKDDPVGSGRVDLNHTILTSGYRGAVAMVNKKGESRGEVLVHIQGH